GKSELQHAHARQLELVTQLLHLGRDEPEVFGHEGETTQFLPDLLEEVFAGDLHETSLFGAGSAARDLPITMERDEMVEPQGIEPLERSFQARDPPSVAVLLQHRPPIQRVAPELTVLAEVVRWHTGHEGALARFVEE